MKGTELEVLNGDEKSRNNQELHKLSTSLATFFLFVGISEEDLSNAKIDLKKIDKLYNIPLHRRVRTWLSYDETIRKIILWFWLNDECIKVNPKKRVNKIFKSEGVDVQPLLEEGKDNSGRKKKSFLASRVWMESNTLPFEDTITLKGVLSVNGFLSGIEFMTSQVWSGVLFSFLTVELYYWLAYTGLRYGKTLKDIFFPQQGRAGILANSMTAPTVWPILFVLPAAYGLFRSILKPRSLPSDPATMLENVKKTSSEYKSSFWQDFLIWYLFPKHHLKSRIRDAETHLLLDGRSSPETRKEMLGVLQKLVAQSNHETQLMAIQCLTELADSLGKRDIKQLIEAGVSREELLNRLELKLSAMEILEDLGLYHPNIIESSKNKVVNLISPIRRYIHAHYALWELGNPKNNLLQLVFWVQKVWRVYSKGALFLILIQAIQRILERKRLESECHEAENVWLYMPQIQDYNCSVCGDLSVYYKDMFTVRDCMNGILSTPRNTSFLVEAFQRFGHRFPLNMTINFQAQTGMNNNNIPVVMNTIKQYCKNVFEINFAVPRQDKFDVNGSFVEMSKSTADIFFNTIKELKIQSLILVEDLDYESLSFGLGNTGALSLGEILNQTALQILDLHSNQIGNLGCLGLVQGLQGSKVKKLNLVHNKISGVGLKNIASVLAQSELVTLDFGWNQIGDIGAKEIAQGLLGSQLRELSLWSNEIGDIGAEFLGQELPNSIVEILNLNDNKIGNFGTKNIGESLEKSRIVTLDLSRNSISILGGQEIGKGLLNSQVENLYLGWNTIGDSGASGIAQGLIKSKIILLSLNNNNISDAGAQSIGNILSECNLKSLDIAGNKIGIMGLEAIGRGLLGSKVDFLDVSRNKIPSGNIEYIIKYVFKSGVKNINFGYTQIGDIGAALIGKELSGSNITTLDISGNKISGMGTEALSKGLMGSKVIELILFDNRIGDMGAQSLGYVLSKSKVSILNLMANQIGDIGVQGISEGLPLSEVTELSLVHNKIGDIGADFLGKALKQSALLRLSLMENEIGIAGAQAIGRALSGSKLIYLNLVKNKVSDVGAAGLGEGLPGSNLKEIYLMANDIGDVGADALARGIQGSQLEVLDLSLNKISDAGIKNFSRHLLPIIFQERELWIEELDTSRKKITSRAKTNSIIRNINFNGNTNITNEGVKDLCDVLPYTDIFPSNVIYSTSDKRNNNITSDTTFCLSSSAARLGLPFSMDILGKVLVFLKNGVSPSRRQALDFSHIPPEELRESEKDSFHQLSPLTFFNPHFKNGFYNKQALQIQNRSSNNDFSAWLSIAGFFMIMIFLYRSCTKRKNQAQSFLFVAEHSRYSGASSNHEVRSRL